MMASMKPTTTRYSGMDLIHVIGQIDEPRLDMSHMHWIQTFNPRCSNSVARFWNKHITAMFARILVAVLWHVEPEHKVYGNMVIGARYYTEHM